MSDIGAAARALILQSTKVVQMVSTRVYSDQLPQTAKVPAIVYAVQSTDANDGIDGALGVDDSTIEVHCLAATRSEANELHRAVFRQLQGVRGVSAGVTIRVIYQDGGQYHATDLPDGGSDAYRYITSQDFGFVYGSLERSC